MEEPLESTFAFCEVCQTMRIGDLNPDLTASAKGLGYFYMCREADKQGVRHTFYVMNAKAIKELQDKNTKEAREALNTLKTQQRTKDAAIVLGLGTTVFFLKEGGELLKHHHTHDHDSDTSHTDHTPGHDQGDLHGTTDHASHTSVDHSHDHSGGVGDSIGEIIEWVADGLSRFLRH